MPNYDPLSRDWSGYKVTESEFKMRMGISAHHTNPRSATLHFWRQTSSLDEYKQLQYRRRIQTNQPDSSNQKKEEHMVIAQRLADMEKHRVGTRFMDREVTEEDKVKPLFEKMKESCQIM